MDYFTLLGLNTDFDIDEQQLENNYHLLARQFHPDRFTHKSSFEQKEAMMMSANINEAYRIIKSPLERAAYLLAQYNIDADAPEHTQFPAHFLMQQMQWRERLDDIDHNQDLYILKTEITEEYHHIISNLKKQLKQQLWKDAAENLRQGRFLQKLLDIIHDRIQ